MLKKLFLPIFFLLLFPTFVLATSDLRIESEDIRFSKTTLIAGDEVRIYAKIFNNGSEDVSGYATFFQGNTVIADSQVISVISGGAPEEVYVDFIVPSSSFNLRAEIRGTDPEDINISNNTALTGIFTPVLDDDRDGVPNGSDNCPSVKNADQTDSDSDSKGNACDSDDDNDGLSDSVEAELGSSPVNKDSDGDGVLDPDDAYPTDGTKSKIEEKKPVAKPAEVQKVINKVVEEIKKETPKTAVISTSTNEEKKDETILTPVVPDIDELKFSANANFNYTRDDWDTFTFHAQDAGSDSTVYEWSFGDGVKSGKDKITHTFRKPGAYTVTLKTTDLSGVISKDSTVILIPFFSLSNNIVLLAVIMLVLLLIIGFSMIVAISRKQKVEQMYEAIEHENFDDLNEDEMLEDIVPKKKAKKLKKPTAKKTVKKKVKKIRVKESD